MSTVHTLETELQIMDTRAKQVADNIRTLDDQLRQEKKVLGDVAKRYNELRRKLLDEKFRETGTYPCTRCGEAIALGKARFIYIEGRCERDGGMGTYGYENFALLQRACPFCWQSAADKHGMRTENTFFHAFEARKGPDAWYARKFGIWTKLDEKCVLPEPTDQVVDKFATEYGLPARLEVG